MAWLPLAPGFAPQRGGEACKVWWPKHVPCLDPSGRFWVAGPGQRSQTHICLHREVHLEEEQAAPSPVGSGGCSLSCRLKACGLGIQFGTWIQGPALD